MAVSESSTGGAGTTGERRTYTSGGSTGLTDARTGGASPIVDYPGTYPVTAPIYGFPTASPSTIPPPANAYTPPSGSTYVPYSPPAGSPYVPPYIDPLNQPRTGQVPITSPTDPRLAGSPTRIDPTTYQPITSGMVGIGPAGAWSPSMAGAPGMIPVERFTAGQAPGVTIGAPSLAQLYQSAGATIGPAAQARLYQAAMPAPISWTNASAGQIGPAALATAARIAPNATAEAKLAIAAQLERQYEQEMRARQIRALDAVEDVAMGRVTTPAELLAKRQSEVAMADQMAMAGMVKGYDYLTAMRAGMATAGQLQQKAALDNALIRAQEQIQSRYQLLGGLEGVRGQDIAIASENARLQNAVNLQNSALATQVSQFNAAQANERNRLQAQLETAVSQGNAAAINAIKIRQAELNTQVNIVNSQGMFAAAAQNQDIAAKVGMFNAGQGNQVSMFNAGETNVNNRMQAQLTQQNNQFNAGQGNQVGMFNSDQINAIQKMQAQLSQQNNQFNVGQFNTVGLTNAAAQNDAYRLYSQLLQNNAQFNAAQTNATGMFNVGEQNTFDRMMAQLGQQNIWQNTGAQNSALQFGANAANDINRLYMQMLQQNEQFNTSTVNDMTRFYAGLGSEEGRFNVAQGNAADQYWAGQNRMITEANQRAAIEAQRINQAYQDQLRQQIIALRGQDLGLYGQIYGIDAATGRVNTDQANRDRDALLASYAAMLAYTSRLGSGGGTTQPVSTGGGGYSPSMKPVAGGYGFYDPSIGAYGV